MVVAGLVFAGVAALIHVYIFYLESVVWTAPRTRAVFGVRSEQDALTTRVLAFNQGFYNLFLAVAVGLGIVVTVAGGTAVGATLVFTGAGSMVAASLVLVVSRPAMVRAALIQGLVPLLGVAALAAGLAA
ncbi:DUF1304 domain-containing protein [Solwaraspora sp. WMMD406]|uniref:DUF1304 domain-containing protein n=1 Tax=Solwaraspora sp. WMMD406 TaxID=3016095 RepID=UPI002416AF47|nr:DUF1304 domain-containing protein [Solwaraspora sp. WMMD406]MDG4766154.1 DUF1304 domain-containing protein [Solwaraspora sp. WMMD406]MDG4768700.1 DUF1304 domain-containing protein [Solwaraspora sp. WMMD406]